MQRECQQIYSARANEKEWRDLQRPVTDTWTSFVTSKQNHRG